MVPQQGSGVWEVGTARAHISLVSENGSMPSTGFRNEPGPGVAEGTRQTFQGVVMAGLFELLFGGCEEAEEDSGPCAWLCVICERFEKTKGETPEWVEKDRWYNDPLGGTWDRIYNHVEYTPRIVNGVDFGSYIQCGRNGAVVRRKIASSELLDSGDR